jgi:hypothetical protein
MYDNMIDGILIEEYIIALLNGDSEVFTIEKELAARSINYEVIEKKFDDFMKDIKADYEKED